MDTYGVWIYDTYGYRRSLGVSIQFLVNLYRKVYTYCHYIVFSSTVNCPMFARIFVEREPGV